MYLQYSCPLIYHLWPNVWKESYTISVSISVDVPLWLPYSKDKFISCVVPGPSQWFFHSSEEIVIAWTHIEWVRWCSRISHCQQHKKSLSTAVVWILVLSRRMMGFCTTKCCFLLSAGRMWCCKNMQYYSVFLSLRRLIYKLSSEVGCGEVTNPN